MNVDHILSVFNDSRVQYLLVGGMNFMLRHDPVLTFDVDLWIEDSPENRARCEQALAALDAEWGESEANWAPVANRSPGWLNKQSVYCLSTPHGAVDIFRRIEGLDDWAASYARSFNGHTSGGIPYAGLSDEDMLLCQKAIPDGKRSHARIAVLESAVRRQSG
jgi:hypothetical protein